MLFSKRSVLVGVLSAAVGVAIDAFIGRKMQKGDEVELDETEDFAAKADTPPQAEPPPADDPEPFSS